MGSLVCFLLVFCFCKIKGKPVDVDSGRLQCSIDVDRLKSDYVILADKVTSVAENVNDVMAGLRELSLQFGISIGQTGDNGVSGPRVLEKRSSEFVSDVDVTDTYAHYATIRGRRDVRSLFELSLSNAESVREIRDTVEKLSNDSHKYELSQLVEMSAMSERLDSLQKTTNSGVISMFTLLSDIAFSTSPQIEKDRKLISELMDYLRQTIVLKNDSDVLVNKMKSVFEWYLKDKSQYVSLSCLDALEKGHRDNGLYNITVPGTSDPLEVFCDQTTDGGGWLVFQRRKDGTVGFYRNWTEYKHGFGAKDGEFWIGNDVLHALTTASDQELRVDLTDFDNVTAYAKYTTFFVAAESDNYRLTVGGFSGSAGDSMAYQNKQGFSTQDRDNDIYGGSCAKEYVGAWWYSNCHRSNLNGLYSHHKVSADKYVTWYRWKNNFEALQKTEMKIKPKS